MLAAAFLSCVRSSGSCITSSRKPITRIFSSVFSSKSWGITAESLQKYSFPSKAQKDRKKQRKRWRVKVIRTCECLDTQWRSTFKTLFVAALLITNSLSPFLWSVGKPGARFDKVTVKLTSYTTEHYYLYLQTHSLLYVLLFCFFFCIKKLLVWIFKTIQKCSQLDKYCSRDMDVQ